MKSYIYKVLVMFIGIVVFSYGYFTIFFEEIGLYNDFIDPSLFLSLGLIIVSPFLFFVSDIVFKKWLGFALVWILLSILLIVPAATHSGGIITGPTTKEEYAIFMSVLFVPISLLVLYFTSRDERKRKGE